MAENVTQVTGGLIDWNLVAVAEAKTYSVLEEVARLTECYKTLN